MTRARLYDGAQRRFQAHDRRWHLIQETKRGSFARMRDWSIAYLRWQHMLERRRYEPPKVTPIGNLHDLIALVPPPRNLH